MTGDLGFYRILNGFIQLDMIFNQWVHHIQTPWLVHIMILITYLGFSVTFLILSAVISIYMFLLKRQLWEPVFLNVSLFSAWLLMWFLKNWFERARPAGEALTAAGGFSFPSGHAMLSVAFYGFIAGLLISERSKKSKKIAISLYILVVLIGFSRVYLNVHYLSDVLAGFLFGFICLIASLTIMKTIKGKQGAI